MTQWTEEETRAWANWRAQARSVAPTPPDELHQRILAAYPRARRRAQRRRQLSAAGVGLAVMSFVALGLFQHGDGPAPDGPASLHQLHAAQKELLIAPEDLPMMSQGPCSEAFSCRPAAENPLITPRIPST